MVGRIWQVANAVLYFPISANWFVIFQSCIFSPPPLTEYFSLFAICVCVSHGASCESAQMNIRCHQSL